GTRTTASAPAARSSRPAAGRPRAPSSGAPACAIAWWPFGFLPSIPVTSLQAAFPARLTPTHCPRSGTALLEHGRPRAPGGLLDIAAPGHLASGRVLGLLERIVDARLAGQRRREQLSHR